MKSPTEIHSNSAIELQVYHLMTCYHNYCMMSPFSRQQSFPLQVKRFCRDSSFVTLMPFSAKLSLPARCFSHCFGSHGRTLNYFCNRLLAARWYVTWLVSNHDRSNHDRRIMSENPGVHLFQLRLLPWTMFHSLQCTMVNPFVAGSLILFTFIEIMETICKKAFKRAFKSNGC